MSYRDSEMPEQDPEPEITDEIPENELDAGPEHFALIAEDGSIEEADR